MIHEISFLDDLNEIEGDELISINYVEYLRMFCSRINHHSIVHQSKQYYESLRNDLKNPIRMKKRDFFNKYMKKACENCLHYKDYITLCVLHHILSYSKDFCIFWKWNEK